MVMVSHQKAIYIKKEGKLVSIGMFQKRKHMAELDNQ